MITQYVMSKTWRLFSITWTLPDFPVCFQFLVDIIHEAMLINRALLQQLNKMTAEFEELCFFMNLIKLSQQYPG